MVDQHLVHALFQGADFAGRRLQFDLHHRPVADQGQNFGQGRDGFIGAGQAQVGQVRGGVIADPTGGARHPFQGGVVEHHGLAVRRQLDVQLDAVAVGAGGLEGSEGIFGCALPDP